MEEKDRSDRMRPILSEQEPSVGGAISPSRAWVEEEGDGNTECQFGLSGLLSVP